MKKDIVRLLSEYLSGNIEEPRLKELMEWVKEKEENQVFFDRLCSGRSFRERWEIRKRIDTEKAIRVFELRLAYGRQPFFNKKRVWTTAAAVLLLAGISATLFFRTHPVEEPAMADIVPGSAKAILMMADGKKLNLGQTDSLLLEFGKTKLMDKDKLLTYRAESADELQYNELQIPRGGEYRVMLSDGTVVRLNSCSSLRYPVAFGSKSREVELQGEAYFEVAESAVPFYVRTGEMRVRVYGTVFNINSYKENCIQTALVEGRIGVSVRGNEEEVILFPSQLAEFNTCSHTLSVRDTDLSPYIAWTKGLFVFNNETLEQIMQTLSKWYDVEIFYQNPEVQALHFTGCVRRYERIDRILGALSQSVGVKFRQQGKTLTVSY